MTYVRLAEPTTCQTCGRDLPRRSEAWRDEGAVVATCLHCVAGAAGATPTPPATGPDVVDLTDPTVDELVDLDGPDPSDDHRTDHVDVDDDVLVLPDPGGRVASSASTSPHSLSAEDLPPVVAGRRPSSVAARPRRRRSEDPSA